MRWHWGKALTWLAMPPAIACCTPTTSDGPAPEAVVCAWDVSTSMDPRLAEAGREVCVRAVESLERGSISVRVIGKGSYSSLAEVARLDVAPDGGCTNPFSARCRLEQTREAARLDARRQEAISQIRSYSPGREITGATDIEGALAAIDDGLRAAADTTWRKRAILATDLVATGNSAAGTSEFVAIDLTHVELDVWVQWPGSAAEGRRLRNAFDNRARDAGAHIITYHSLTPGRR